MLIIIVDTHLEFYVEICRIKHVLLQLLSVLLPLKLLLRVFRSIFQMYLDLSLKRAVVWIMSLFQ